LSSASLPPYLVRARRRPLRVAYLVDAHSVTESDIATIRWSALRAWGGRLSPIVPVSSDGIANVDWKLLKAISPDLLVTTFGLETETERLIRRELSPAAIETTNRRTIHGIGLVLDRETLQRVDPRPGPKSLVAFRIETPCELVVRQFLEVNFGPPPSLYPRDDVLIDEYPVKDRASLAAALKALSSHQARGVYLPEVAALPNHLPRSSRYHDTFSVVIGDRPMDLIAAWNFTILSSKRERIQSLWLPTDLARDESLSDTWRSWCFYAACRTHEGHRSTKFASASLDPVELHAIADRISRAENGADLLDDGRLESSPEPEVIGEVFRDAELVHRGLQNAEVLVLDPPERISPRATGYWAADLLVEQEEIDSHSGRAYVWQVPNDEAIVGAFLTNGRIASSYKTPTALVSTGDVDIVLRIPRSEELFRRLLIAPSEPNGLPTRERFENCDLSDKGQYLFDLIEIFGGIGLAYATFQSPLWREVVATMPTVTEQTKSLGFRDLAAIAKRAHQADLGVKDDNYPFDLERFNDSVELLLEKGIFVQGADYRCPSCRYSSWIALEGLSQMLKCSGCSFKAVFPPRQKLGLRLNSLVRRACQQDVVPVLLTIGDISRKSRHSFRFWPQTDVFLNRRSESSFTDIDILCISDGNLFIGEAKQNVNGFKVDDFEKLKECARRLRPARVILSSMSGEPSSDFVARLEELKVELTSFGVDQVHWEKITDSHSSMSF
jgi:hypothetical protein